MKNGNILVKSKKHENCFEKIVKVKSYRKMGEHVEDVSAKSDGVRSLCSNRRRTELLPDSQGHEMR